MIPLSKTLDPADFDQLTEELQIVDRHFTKEREQHPMRRWEYAMALRAYQASNILGFVQYDVGGAGSPFAATMNDYARHIVESSGVRIIDPATPGTKTLAEVVQEENPPLGNAVFCISVLEHVVDLDRFCYHLGCLVAPGGLLFLTVDYCSEIWLQPNGYPIDHYDLHHMRERIFNAYTFGKLTALSFLQRDFSLLGPADYSWHGTHVGPPDQPETCYTFASLALIKRP